MNIQGLRANNPATCAAACLCLLIGLAAIGCQEDSQHGDTVPDHAVASPDYNPSQDIGGPGADWNQAPWQSGICLTLTQGFTGMSHTALSGYPVDLDDGCELPGNTAFICPFDSCRIHYPCRSGAGWGINLCLEDTATGGWQFLGHLQRLNNVGNGTLVPKGEIVGWMGNTGNSYGSPGCPGEGTHLHLEVGAAGSEVGGLSTSPPFPVQPYQTPICSTTSVAPVVCGDFNINPEEDCDGLNLNGNTCLTLGWDYGSLQCTDTCSFDETECRTTVCGNGFIEQGEECDGDPAPVTCEDLGYTSGPLSCTSGACTYDTSQCVGSPDTSIASAPAQNTWTPTFAAQIDCTCSSSATDCHTLYISRVTSINGNIATLEFEKVSGGTPSADIHYWIAVGGDTFPSCLDLNAFAKRTDGVWDTSTSTLQVAVNIWPDLSAFNSAQCGSTKRIFIITGGGGGFENTRLYFQRQAMVFTKVCNSN